jgi:hypothetical protein
MVVDPIARTRHEPVLYKAVLAQYASALLHRFSYHEHWWNLVHGGGAVDVPVPEGSHSAVQPPGMVTVPSLDEHIASALNPGGAGVLRTRDLVMSALGCGVAYGLGFESRVESMLNQRWRDVRFFLCSPLGEVPVRVDGSTNLIEPLEPAATFPDLDERSAALSQLLLCLLRRVWP